VLGSFVGVLFDGIAYGSLLFIIAIGLSVTLGLMNFINLAHGAFAMLGGYVSVKAMNLAGVPFLAALPLAFIVAALAGVVLERTLYQRLYRASHLDQVLFSIGLVYVSIAAATYLFGPGQQLVELPPFLRGQIEVGGRGFGAYRLFLIATVAVLTVALHFLLERTRFGAAVRASVDNAVAAAGLGINVNRWARGWRDWAAGSALTCWVSTRCSRSNSWSIFCSSSRLAASARSRVRFMPR
jgi:branched-chain amino acid transport system permease protein